MGSGCGLVGRAVASNTRDPWFKSSNWQFLLSTLLKTVLKRQKKKKEALEWLHFYTVPRYIVDILIVVAELPELLWVKPHNR